MNYTAILTTAGSNTKATAPSVAEALGKLKELSAKSKSILSVKLGKAKAEKVLYPLLVRRLYVNPTYRLILGKEFERRLPAKKK